MKDTYFTLREVPWFWGNEGIFMTPWFPSFNANITVVSKMSVWVSLHNLPLHFWHHKILEGIGNTLGKYIKTNTHRTKEANFTFARICVEVDLSKGLPNHIHLIHNNRCCTKFLDF